MLRRPDEETATRALAAAGRDALRVSPTVLELTDPGKGTAIARKLRKQGIFMDELEDQPRVRKARRRRRR